MKKLLALFIISGCTSSFALPIAWEPFNYTYAPGGPPSGTNLVGQVNPGGFTWWQAGPTTGGTNVPSIYPGNLSYPGLAPSTGNAVQFGGIDSGGMAARFSGNSGSTFASSGTVYASFIMKVTDITGLSTSGIFCAGFNNTAGSQGNSPTVVASRLYGRAVTGGFNIGTSKNGAAASDIVWDTTVRNVNDTNFIVVSYQIVGDHSGGDDVSQMWINPDSSTFNRNDNVPAPTLTPTTPTTAGTDLSGVGSFCVWNRNATEFKSIIIDQLTIGTSWADVTLTNVPVAITTQPRNARSIVGGKASFSVGTFNAATFQWQHNSVNIPGATQNSLTFNNVLQSDAGTYHVTVGNGPAPPVTSVNVTLTVFPDVYARLTPLWSIPPATGPGGPGPGTRPYFLVDNGNQPSARFFAFNSLSNTILLTSHTNSSTLASTGMVYVLDANTGADLYQMNADSSVVTTGLASTNGPLTLNTINVADDGAIFGANISDKVTANSILLRIYRWDNSGPSAAPVNIFEGDPNGGNNIRWGDSMAIRGAGNNTQLLFDNDTGGLGATLTNNGTAWQAGLFTNVIGGLVGGRALKFGDTNSFWEKHGGPLNLATYDTTPLVWSSTLITNYSFPNPLSVSDFNLSMKLLAGLSFASDSTTPDTVALYDLTDPSQPLLLANYDFPVNHNANGNGNGRVVWSGDKVFALDSNNGLMAFTVVPHLLIAPSGANVVLSWPTNFTGYTLQASPSLLTTYTNVSTGTIVNDQYTYTTAPSSAALFYKLRK